MIAHETATRWKLEFSLHRYSSGSPHEFKVVRGGVHTGERHANGSECTKGPDSVEMDSIGDAKDTLKRGNSKGYRALCSGTGGGGGGRANVISGENARTELARGATGAEAENN